MFPSPVLIRLCSNNALRPSEAISLDSGVRQQFAVLERARPDSAVLDHGQRLSEHGLLHAPERAAVADDQHASVGMARCDFAQGSCDSLGVVLVRLAVPWAPV